MSHVAQQPRSMSMQLAEKPRRADDDHQHQSCHNARWRRVMIPAIILLFTAIVLVFLDAGVFGSGAGGGLLRRATGDSVNNGQNSGFVKNKLYLIIVFVGLLLVVIAAIALSFWCCKGAFQNPLCCPCYLCACCGGLACLECISCGLCAEGFEDLNV